MRVMCVLALVAVSMAGSIAAEGEFVTDPNSPELQAYAAPMDLDESLYGCGPLEQPGATCYVALDGDDEADGTSWDTAWRHVHVAVTRLAAGDTLIIGEGEYIEPTIAVGADRQTDPGRDGGYCVDEWHARGHLDGTKHSLQGEG